MEAGRFRNSDMKVIRREKTVEFKNSKNCTALEYPLGNSDIGIAIIEISGRYPSKGYVFNEKCTEIAYVLSGTGTVTFKNGKSVDLGIGDVIMLEKEEQYYWDGDCSLCISCSPEWSPEQHKRVNE